MSIINWSAAHPGWPIAFGTLLIALGGYIATWGWNAQTSAENLQTLRQEDSRRTTAQRAAMLNSLAAEVSKNERILARSMYTETDPETLKAIGIYTPLQDKALAAAIASGLFATEESDELLYKTITTTQRLITNLHAATDFAQQDMLRVGGNRDEAFRAEQIAKLRASVRDSPVLQSTRTAVSALRVLLATQRSDGGAAHDVDENEKEKRP